MPSNVAWHAGHKDARRQAPELTNITTRDIAGDLSEYDFLLPRRDALAQPVAIPRDEVLNSA